VKKFVNGKCLDFGIGRPVAGLLVNYWKAQYCAGNVKVLGGCVGSPIRIRGECAKMDFLAFIGVHWRSLAFILWKGKVFGVEEDWS
jgi:hypothetical protein